MLKLYCKDDMFNHGGYISVPGKNVRSSKYFQWNFDVPATTNDIVVHTDLSLRNYSKSHTNRMGWLIESPVETSHEYSWIAENNDKFNLILTHNKKLLDLHQNFKFCPLGGSWLWDDEIKIWDKTKNISIICSHKQKHYGHILRHAAIHNFHSVLDVYGRGYNKIERKITALKDYRFSVCIENCKEDFYFSEKLMDCLLSGTIPIYWGCPSIGKFFNTSAILTFDTLEELQAILADCDEDFYNSKMDAIYENFELAQKYIMPEDYMFEKYFAK